MKLNAVHMPVLGRFCMHNDTILMLIVFMRKNATNSISFCANVCNMCRYSYDEQTGAYKEIQDEQTGVVKEDLTDAIKE